MSYTIVSRSLNADELIMCARVFAGTLPAALLKSKVLLSNGLGAGGRPFTSFDIGVSTYKIYIGPGAFDASARTTIEYKGTFIHEMTHVWQMYRGWSGFLGVWASSLVSQACRQGNAYLYGEGNLKQAVGQLRRRGAGADRRGLVQEGLEEHGSALPLHPRQHP